MIRSPITDNNWPLIANNKLKSKWLQCDLADLFSIIILVLSKYTRAAIAQHARPDDPDIDMSIVNIGSNLIPHSPILTSL